MSCKIIIRSRARRVYDACLRAGVLSRRYTHAKAFLRAANNPAPALLSVSRIAAYGLSALLLAGCGANDTSLTPVVTALDTLPKPDRMLVFEFAAAPNELELTGSVDAQVLKGVLRPQTNDDIRVGGVLAKSIADNLVMELRSRGIDARQGTATAPVGDVTVSIKGRFLRLNPVDPRQTIPGFVLGAEQVRIDLQIYQGTGVSLGLAARGNIVTESNLKPRPAPESAAIEADAKRIARLVADRVANFYRQQGWIK